MPGLSRKVQHSSPVSTPVSTSSSSSISGCSTPDGRSASIWSRSNTEDVTFAQLQKFWDGLSTDDRRKLLRIDKQALFEQVRKNLYCSRCHGLLVEGFSQIVTYGKSLYAAVRGNAKSRKVFPDNKCSDALQDDARDPSLHPWCGLATTRDSMLTVLDCFLERTPLEVLQNVFESARGKERERELLYPDACGGNGRGWISQSSPSYSSGRGYGMKETCALHTTRLSCEALVDFWSALSEETRRSLLRMKEEDFIERLMFRFDSKRFCRDCRRNVLREFKEMKELKRARKEPRCTRWFCAPDTRFQYEVSNSSVRADWHDSFAGEVGTLYKYFEWALGTGEGKADIFGFEGVGLAESAELEGLELAAVQDCFITIRAWRRDGRSNDICVKAHGLKGEFCVHRRLFVGDGYVSITEGQSIQRFFEHAEETEEEEDEEALEKDGNEIEGEGSSRSQKHAKSPELARDFLLDAATVIFKEQVEKAFREGTARRNAHSIFVSLALGLLEDRVRVACKEIATLEKQNKLLEEEEHEKREEEERRERRKLKEKEKKQRRKEKLKFKEREKDNKTRATGNRHWTAEEKPSQGDKENGEEQSVPASDITEVRAAPDEPRSLDGMENAEPCFRKGIPTTRDQTEPCSGQDDYPEPCSGDVAATRELCSGEDGEDVATTRDHGAFVVQQLKSAKRRSHAKRQQVFYSRRGRQDSQQCACTAIWMKDSKGTAKSARNLSLAEDSSTKQQDRTGAPGNPEQTSDSCELISNGPVLRSRMVCEEGLSYTKVLSRSWTQDQADDSSLQNDFGVQEESRGNGSSLHLEAGHDAVSKPAVAEPSGIAEVDQGTQSELQQQVELEPQQLAAEEQSVADQHAEKQPVAGQHAEEQPASDQLAEEQPAGDEEQLAATAVDEDSHSTTGSSGKPDWLTPQVQQELVAAQVVGGPSNPSPTQAPELARYITGVFPTSSAPGPAAPKGHYSMMEMLPTAGPAQVRHPFPMVQHHHRPPPAASHHHPQAGYGCFPVWPGPPPPPPPPPHHVPHHHLPPHHSARGNFLPAAAAAAHGGPRGFIMPGPPPSVYAYPRYPMPARMMHRPSPVGVSSRQFLRGEVVSRPLAGSGLPLPWVRPSPAGISGSIRPGLHRELDSGLGQYDRLPPSSDFSLFHFGDPATAAAAATGFVPPTPISTIGNGPVAGSGATVTFYESGSPTTTGSSTTDSSVDGDSLELADDVVEVSSKCMGPLASGIDNKARMMAAAGGEYSLFAGASGKGFGFF